MKVMEVNSPMFWGKTRFLSKEGYANMQELLTKMNEQTVYTQGKNTFKSSILNKIHIGNQGYFADGRWLQRQTYSPAALVQGDSFVQTHKTRVKISNLDGKLEILEKPWYRTSKSVTKKIEQFIKTGLDEFENENIVKKHLVVRGFTEEGFKKFKGNAK